MTNKAAGHTAPLLHHGGILLALFGGTGLLLLAERRALMLFPSVSLRGDVVREMQFLAQFGQGTCTVIVALLIWLLDQTRRHYIWPLIGAVILASLAANVVKHATGRVRPAFESAGQFEGPSPTLPESRQSFPSGHSAAAAAMAYSLAYLYPRGKYVFWLMALICGAMRVIERAHWPSDVLAGLGVGYFVGGSVWALVELRCRRGSIVSLDSASPVPSPSSQPIEPS